ncbi:MAG: bifunctional diguanylate cyclase/phosphodiesterase, partial [Planctomycetota bacterium]
SGHRWMLCRGLAVRDEEGIAYRIAGSLTDITEGKVADSLTGLPNRVLFRDRVARCVQEYRPEANKEFAVLFLDVDGFKLINDTYGHDVGDDFLVALAKRLHQGLRQADAILSRLGGDEFAVLIENLQHVDHAILIAERLRDRMKEPFSIGGRDLFVGASIGISYSGQREVEVDTLLREADTAMYFCKVRPELDFTLFRDEMLADATEQLELGADLRQAIEKSELQLHYQPIVDAHSGRIVGVESLTRWHHGTLGSISPDRFIPIAESNGFINELGKWALDESCRQAKAWQDEFANEMTVCVNVSIRQLSDSDFFSTVKDVLFETGLEARFLRLEVTESLLTQKPEDTIDILQKVRDIGVTIAVDDFGTGYSSLAYLHQFPLQILKVDRSFVDQMLQAEKSMAIVRSIIALARSLNLNLVAEGVETQEQLEVLRDLGCDYIQGYLISKPLDANSAHSFIAEHTQRTDSKD